MAQVQFNDATTKLSNAKTEHRDAATEQQVEPMVPEDLVNLGMRSKSAGQIMALAPTAKKNQALELAAKLLVENRQIILDANQVDIDNAQRNGVTKGVIDRLRLDGNRLASMADGLRQVASLPDPVGEVESGWVRPNGLKVSKVRVPLGVIGIVYENRPNVTSDAAGLCIKSGNAVMLRGSSGALASNLAIEQCIRQALAEANLPQDAVTLVRDISRDLAIQFMQLRGIIDCLIPRGGRSLISSIRDNATVPYILDGDGNCHIYVDKSADLAMALKIVVNAKTQRPSVCNAAESLVVHSDIAHEFLPLLSKEMSQVELVGDERSRDIVSTIGLAAIEDFAMEFLDLKMSVAVVDSLDEAITHIRKNSSGHSEAIITNDYESANKFVSSVDCAAVLVNASTRFIDGGELGLGAEIGISTQKLHARGPMGLEALTTLKFVVQGSGQIRE